MQSMPPAINRQEAISEIAEWILQNFSKSTIEKYDFIWIGAWEKILGHIMGCYGKSRSTASDWADTAMWVAKERTTQKYSESVIPANARKNLPTN